MNKNIGANIKNLRELKNYTQKYMADRLNISTTAYGNIERNKATLTLSRLQQIAQILDVHYTYLIELNFENFLPSHANPSGAAAGEPHTTARLSPETPHHALLKAMTMIQEEHVKIMKWLDTQLHKSTGRLSICFVLLLQWLQPEMCLSLLPDI